MSVWTYSFQGFDPGTEKLREALCTLGNGYFATRGAAPESPAGENHYPGTYGAGLYNRLTTEIAGRKVENEDLVNLPNWLVLRFRVEDGPWFDPAASVLKEYLQTLDMRQGVLIRTFVVVDEEGRETRVTQRRFAHMRDPHLAGLQTTFLPENWSGTLEVVSGIDGTVTNSGVERYRNLNSQHLRVLSTGFPDRRSVFLQVETTQSRVEIAMAARTEVVDRDPVETSREAINESGFTAHRLQLRLSEGVPTTVDKVVTLFTSRDRAISEAGHEAKTWLGRVGSFDESLESHVSAWDHLWRRFHLDTGTDEEEARILNLHSFHLLQTVSKHTIDLDVGVPARGWHGEAYRGHVFWDELFIFPYLNLRVPDLTRSLLLYRYRRLPEARWAARESGLQGALYPWQSGSSGREETQVLHLNPESGNWLPDNSSLQRHVNIAIAYNVWQHYQTTYDVDFLAYSGVEMMVEITRMLADLASYNRAKDRYEILGVMGPDEYHDAYPEAETPGLNNNAYTNVMTAWVLGRVREAFEAIPEFRRSELREKLHIDLEELERWDEIAHKMRVCFHDDGIISQFEGYEDLEEFDWEGYADKYGDIHRLDRILEAEGDTPNRYKVSKQADVLMLFYLLSASELRSIFERLEYPFDEETIPRNIDYYDRRTSHGSTLSRLVSSWVTVRSDRKRSWEAFREALFSDVSDIQGGTTEEGIHLGAMAGTVDLVQRGYSGIEAREDVLWINPSIPDQLGHLEFQIRYRGHLLTLHITTEQLTVTTHPGGAEPIRVGIGDRIIELEPGNTEVASLV